MKSVTIQPSYSIGSLIEFKDGKRRYFGIVANVRAYLRWDDRRKDPAVEVKYELQNGMMVDAKDMVRVVEENPPG